MSEIDETKPAPKRHMGVRIMKGIAWTIAGVLLLLIVLTGGLAWYSTTADFQQRVGKEVVSVLEDATGGRVELPILGCSASDLSTRKLGYGERTLSAGE